MVLDAIQERKKRSDAAIVGSFSGSLAELVGRAQARTLAQLGRELDVDDAGMVAMTPANQVVLRQLDGMLLGELDKLGYNSLVNAFVGTFSTQLPLFQEALDAARKESGADLPKLEFGRTDERMFDSAKVTGRLLLRQPVERAAASARQNALLSMGALSHRDLADLIAKKWQVAVPQAEATAATAMSTYYRTINARAADKIQSALPEGAELTFVPTGPLDKLTRPFCSKLMRAGGEYTRGQIDAMDNGSSIPAFIGFGGYKCRHAWHVGGIRR